MPSAFVADVGATTTRFALVRANGALDSVRSIANSEAADLATVLDTALKNCGKVRPLACILAVAAPVDGDEIAMTNRNWSFSQRRLRRALKLERLVVINDFAAAAYALPHIREADLVAVGSGRPTPRGTMLVCGPGSGFGVATLLRHSGKPRAVPSEAGHMRLGAATADEARILAHLVREEGPVVVEQILSGPGLVRLHRILTGEESTGEAIVASARLGKNPARDARPDEGTRLARPRGGERRRAHESGSRVRNHANRNAREPRAIRRMLLEGFAKRRRRIKRR
jgi:glucokinase